MPARFASFSSVYQPPASGGGGDFQELVDELQATTDLGGETFDAFEVILHLDHSGMTIQNGGVNLLPNARLSNIRMLQGDTYDGIEYPSGEIDIDWINVTFNGQFDQNFGLQQRNEEMADLAGCGHNAVSTGTFRAGKVRFINCTFNNIGNTAISGKFLEIEIINCTFNRVAKHCAGIREWGGTTLVIDGMTCDECGNFLDLHGDGGLFAEPDIAVIENITCTNSTGRAKISGNNWDVEATNWSFEQDNEVNLNMYAAFDLARAPRRFDLDGFQTLNYPQMGFRAGSNPGVTPNTTLNDLYVENSLSGVAVAQVMTVTNSTFDGIHHRYRGTTPTESGNSDINVKTDLEWAQIYDQIELLFAEKRTEWGTSYPASLSYFVPNEVLELMETV